MRRFLIVVAAGVAVAAPSSASAQTVQVQIVRAGFSPSSLTVTAGTTVTWVNRDTVNHQVVSDRGSFVSPILRPSQSFSFTFRAAGTYRYHDGLEPAERGTIRVTGPPPSVTLTLSVPIVTYGGETHLQGVVSSRRAGETVTLNVQPYGQASYAQLAVVTTTTGGVFDFVTKPEILTNYQAQYRSAASQPVTAQVAPKITLLPGGNGYFLTRVTAARSFAGRYVYLQRKTSFGQWISIAKYRLGRLSGKLFRVRPRVGTTYRIFMTVNQAGVGYLSAHSGTQTKRPPSR